MPSSTRERILVAASACVGRRGMTRVTMDDIAREAGLSRATLYRSFPGGREEVLDATVVWEVGRSLRGVSAAMGPDPADPAAVLERGLLAVRDAVEHHEVLQELLRREADLLQPSPVSVMPLVQQGLADWYRPQLASAALRPGVDATMASDLAARMVVSYLETPGRWDLSDPDQVRRLVDEHLVPAILA